MTNEFTPIQESGELLNEYWEGKSNTFVRYYAYAQRGIGLLNEFKYYFIFLFSGYWTVKFTEIVGIRINPAWVVVAGVLGIPVLILIGRWHLYKAQKPIEYVTTMNGSIQKFGMYNMGVRQIELLEDLNKNINQLIESLKK